MTPRPLQSKFLPPSGGPRAPRILICDPSPKTRTVIAAIIGEGRETVQVDSAEAAWLQLQANPVDALITDTTLPGEDGLELCRRIRATPSLASVAVIIVTAVANDDSRLQGLECGADDYLFKPLRPRELRARVEALLRLRQANLTLQTRTDELEAAHRLLVQTQKALFQSEKLALVGTLVAGVAHEINNPLAYIKSGLGSLSDVVTRLGELVSAPTAAAGSLDSGRLQAEARNLTEEGQAIVQEVVEGAARLERISRELKLMAVRPESDLQVVDLASELGKAWRIASLRARAPHQLELRVESARSLLSVPHLLSQVFLNLLINAVQAMGSASGRVRCTAQSSETELVLTLCDTGPGVPPALAARVFEPFFTTKSEGEGTGLGLAISRQIVESLGGSMELVSAPGQGAAFTLRLPWMAPAAVAAVAGAEVAQARSAT